MDVLLIGGLLAAGVLAGLLAGLLGIGGGVIFVLILPWALARLGAGPDEAVPMVLANSLLATLASAAMSLAAHGRHLRSGSPLTGDGWQGRAMLIIGLPAILASNAVLAFVVPQPWYTRPVFEGVVLLMLTGLLVRALMAYRQRHPDPPADPAPQPAALSALGGASGVVAALSGLGGGVVLVPVLRQGLGYRSRSAAQISSGVIALTSIGSLLTTLQQAPATPLPGLSTTGLIVWPVLIPLCIGVLGSAPAGVALGRRVPPHLQSLLMALFMGLLIAFKLLPYLTAR